LETKQRFEFENKIFSKQILYFKSLDNFNTVRGNKTELAWLAGYIQWQHISERFAHLSTNRA